MEAPTRLWPTALHVITPEADVRSPMWQKMWERAGVPPASVQWTALDRAAQPGWQPPGPHDSHGAPTEHWPLPQAPSWQGPTP